MVKLFPWLSIVTNLHGKPLLMDEEKVENIFYDL